MESADELEVARCPLEELLPHVFGVTDAEVVVHVGFEVGVIRGFAAGGRLDYCSSGKQIKTIVVSQWPDLSNSKRRRMSSLPQAKRGLSGRPESGSLSCSETVFSLAEAKGIAPRARARSAKVILLLNYILKTSRQ